MTVYFDKDRKHWRYHFQRAGKRYSGYCLDATGTPVTSRRAAREAEAIERRRIDLIPKIPSGDGATLAMIVAAITPRLKMQAQWHENCRFLREIVAYFGATTPMVAIGQAQVDDYITWALAQPHRIWAGGPNRPRDTAENERYWKDSGRTRTAATVNHYLPMLRAVFDRAHETRDPMTGRRLIEEPPKIANLPMPKRQARPIPDEALTAALEILPPHVSDAVIATLLFGFRRSEVFELEVADVDFAAGGVWLKAERVKNRTDTFLPGGAAAMALMRRLVDQAKERGVTHLVTYRRTRKDPAAQAAEKWLPVKSPKRAWNTAMRIIEAKMGARWRWHDIRAAYITQVAIAAGAVAAQRLARHSRLSTTQGYIAARSEVLRAAADEAADRPALKILTGGKS